MVINDIGEKVEVQRTRSVIGRMEMGVWVRVEGKDEECGVKVQNTTLKLFSRSMYKDTLAVIR